MTWEGFTYLFCVLTGTGLAASGLDNKNYDRMLIGIVLIILTAKLFGSDFDAYR